MGPKLSRRSFLELGSVGFLSGISGCQTVFQSDSRVPISIHIINIASSNFRPLVQLQGIPEGTGAYLGDGYEMLPGTAKVIELEVEPMEYRLRVVIDREGPPLAEELIWDISREECSQQSWIVLNEDEVEDDVQVSLKAEYCN